MNISELFKKTLVLVLSTKPRGTKAQLADSLEINRINFSSFLSGRDNFSEQRKIKIVEYLGFDYLD